MALILQFLSWSLFHEQFSESQDLTLWFWTAQIGIACLIIFVGFIGFSPPVTVIVDESSFIVSQGQRSTEMKIDSSIYCRVISPLQYYRKWYNQVDRYMTHIPEDILLIFSDHKVTAVGINPVAHAILRSALNGSSNTNPAI